MEMEVKEKLSGLAQGMDCDSVHFRYVRVLEQGLWHSAAALRPVSRDSARRTVDQPSPPSDMDSTNRIDLLNSST